MFRFQFYAVELFFKKKELRIFIMVQMDIMVEV